jgi:hypothetical protein
LSVSLDPYTGIRYTYLDLELKGRLDLPTLGIARERSEDGDRQWVDPLVGLRTIWTLGDHLNLIAAGDIGGTSTSDQFSWQAIGLLGYRFDLIGQDANLVAGYRALKQKYEDGDGRSAFKWDVIFHGPVVGLTITF